MNTPSHIARELAALLRRSFPPERIAEIVACLPPDAQERIRQEFAPRLVRRHYAIKIRRKKQP